MNSPSPLLALLTPYGPLYFIPPGDPTLSYPLKAYGATSVQDIFLDQNGPP